MPICPSTAHWKVGVFSSKRFELESSSSVVESSSVVHHWRRAFQLETFGRKYTKLAVCCTRANGHWPFHPILPYFSALRQLPLVNQWTFSPLCCCVNVMNHCRMKLSSKSFQYLDEKVNAHLPYYSTLRKFCNGFFQTFQAGLLFFSDGILLFNIGTGRAHITEWSIM